MRTFSFVLDNAGAQRIAMREGATLSLILTDHLGSTNKLIKVEDHTETFSARYKAWGEQRFGPADPTTNRLFTGQLREKLLGGSEGLYFYGSRYVDVSLGRFTQADSLIPEASQGTQAWDRYAYGNNNPVKYNDPTGHMIDEGCNTLGCDTTKAELEYDKKYYQAQECKNGGGENCPDYKEAIAFTTVGLVTAGAGMPVVDAVGGTIAGWISSGLASTATTAAWLMYHSFCKS